MPSKANTVLIFSPAQDSLFRAKTRALTWVDRNRNYRLSIITLFSFLSFSLLKSSKKHLQKQNSLLPSFSLPLWRLKSNLPQPLSEEEEKRPLFSFLGIRLLHRSSSFPLISPPKKKKPETIMVPDGNRNWQFWFPILFPLFFRPTKNNGSINIHEKRSIPPFISVCVLLFFWDENWLFFPTPALVSICAERQRTFGVCHPPHEYFISKKERGRGQKFGISESFVRSLFFFKGPSVTALFCLLIKVVLFLPHLWTGK